MKKDIKWVTGRPVDVDEKNCWRRWRAHNWNPIQLDGLITNGSAAETVMQNEEPITLVAMWHVGEDQDNV